MHPLQRIDPTTGVRFWPSWSQQQREQLNEGLAGVAQSIDAGRSFAAVAAELRRLANTADICSQTLGSYDRLEVVDAARRDHPGDRVKAPLSPSQQRVAAILGPLDGARVAGGCSCCDAYQTVEPVQAGVWMIEVHHDDWCPVLAAHRKAAE